MRIIDVYEAADITSLPVDPIAAAAAVGVRTVRYSDICRVYERSMDELYRVSRYGFSYVEDGRRVIAVNENACGERRRRFTAAHELGHCLLGPHGERAADKFAAELLAPLPVLSMCGVGSDAEIARLCGISAEAARIRLSELGRFRPGADDLRIIIRFSGFIDRYLRCNKY